MEVFGSCSCFVIPQSMIPNSDSLSGVAIGLPPIFFLLFSRDWNTFALALHSGSSNTFFRKIAFKRCALWEIEANVYDNLVDTFD